MRSIGLDRQSPADIKKSQDALLLETLQRAYEMSPHYRALFQTNGLTPADVRGTEDLTKLPFTAKSDIQKDNWAFLAAKGDDILEFVSSTGTTGEPIFIGMTGNDLERLAYNEEKSFGYVGANKQDLFHIAVTCDNLFIAGMAYYRGLLRTGASVARIGPQGMMRHVDLIRKLRPTGMVAVPSFMVRLARYAEDNGINPRELGIRKIVLIGDTVRDVDFSSNALGRLIEDSFDTRCYSTYGITEGQVSFCECEFREGLHSHPDLVVTEIVDDEGNPLPDGEVGELVITTLQLEGMPLIRYKTGDVTLRIADLCPCGRNSVKLGPIVGRKDHRLKVKGVTLYPKTLENAMLEVMDVVNYQIVAYTGDDHSDHIGLKVGSYRTDDAFVASLRDTVRAKARVTPEIEVESPEGIEARLFEGGSRKPILFKDMRRPRHA